MTQRPVGVMYRPTSIVHNSSSLYVVEQFNHRVSKWDFTPGLNNFNIDNSWGSNGDGTSGIPGVASASNDDHFNFPTGIALDAANDHMFVSDTRNNRIRVVTLSTGDFENSIGTPGRENGQLYRPAHIAVNNGNNILAVADSRNHRISVFDNVSFAFLGIATPPPEGFHTPHGVKHNINNLEFYYSDVINGKIYPYLHIDGTTPSTPVSIGTPGTDPTDPNQLFYPSGSTGSTGVAGDSYVADTRNNKIKEFTEPGVLTDKITGEGTGDGELFWPEYAVGFSNTDNYLCVCNTRNNRIEVYTRGTGFFRTNFGSP